MAYILEYAQWYRCGPDGDDKDFENRTMQFETYEKAMAKAEELVSGKYRGRYDMSVKMEDIFIFPK
jgi:hypothetical protein